ncbi:hypothetical protein [Daejeonella oryzae]|uniref:hypothetical protein n=1 Tax=Daejeonella oryzae TaxID=1122943 RepID=UPI00047A3157|nr:hypothetical protein [Daejeonella oryzae]
MIRASALYMVIIIALVIATLCSSLIVVAYFYRLQYQRKFRFEKLENNLKSGINIVLGTDSQTNFQKTIDLFNNQEDSISIQKISWGFYDIGIVKSYFQHDTLFKSFSLASIADSLKSRVIYLTDEERPLYISGKTTIKGNAYLPKSGIVESYVDGNSYEGDKRLVVGEKRTSKSTLPGINKSILNNLKVNPTLFYRSDTSFNGSSTVENSFFNPVRRFYFKKPAFTINQINLKGNIIILSTGLITIDSTSILDNVLIFAKSIYIKSGFKGRAQMFAMESIITEKNCVFNYPSTMCVIKPDSESNNQPRISLGDNSVLKGILFSYEKDKSDAQTLIDIGGNVLVEGEVFSKGMIRFKDGATINGGITANRVIYETNATLFENYLVNTTLNSEALSPYYLTSPIFYNKNQKRSILEWLE